MGNEEVVANPQLFIYAVLSSSHLCSRIILPLDCSPPAKICSNIMSVSDCSVNICSSVVLSVGCIGISALILEHLLWAVIGVGGTWAEVSGSHRGWFWVVLNGSWGGGVSQYVGSCCAAFNWHLSYYGVCLSCTCAG